MTETTSKPRRRWLRFSLRAALLLVAALGVSLGATLHQVRKQGRAVAALEKLGCNIGYAEQGLGTFEQQLRKVFGEREWRNVVAVGVENVRFNDADMDHIDGLAHLSDLSVSRTQVTDAALAYVKGLKLWHLGLAETQITDERVGGNPSELETLKTLSLRQTRVTDAGASRISEDSTHLDHLFLDDTRVSDAGMVDLAELTNLKGLSLDGTQVTDRGLMHLGGLSQLESLWLKKTQVTDAGVQELKNALPNCQIIR